MHIRHLPLLICTALFILLNKHKSGLMKDLEPQKETEGFIDEP